MKTAYKPTINTLLNWQSKSGQSCHCLLRIYVNLAANKTIVIVSELASNKQNITISHDIERLTSSVMNYVPKTLSLSKEQITWIVHYGDFSQPRSYANLGYNDEFALVKLSSNSNDEEWKVLTTKEIHEILDGGILEPVEQVIAQLNQP
jgi:hypothetical protein